MPLTLIPPTSPWRGFRTIDGWGAGGFGAPRGPRTHAGVDLVAVSGDDVVAPCACTVTLIGLAYPEADLASIHLRGTGADARDYDIKLLYARPMLDTIVGREFDAGEPIAIAQSVAGYWMAQHPERGTMTNHVHVELRIHEADGVRLLDPTPYFALPEAV
jgi:hypothetical protein